MALINVYMQCCIEPANDFDLDPLMILILVHSTRGTEQEVNLDLDEHLTTLVTLDIVDNILRKKAYQNAGHFVRSSDSKIQFHTNSQLY